MRFFLVLLALLFCSQQGMTMPLDEVSKPLSPRISKPQIKTALYCKDIDATRSFYEKLGVKFTKAGVQQEYSSEVFPFFVIHSLDADVNAYTKFQYTLGTTNASIMEEQMDPDGRVLEIKRNQSLKEKIKTFSDWTLVLRSHDVDKTKDFYDFLGQWNQEQHGNGPIHYSTFLDGGVAEIYPLRKGSGDRIEFFTSIQSDSLPEEIAFPSDKTLINISDPDGRIIILQKKL